MRPATLGTIATLGVGSVASTYSKPGKSVFGFKKKKKRGYDDDDDDFDDAFIGAALGFGAGSIIGFLINDDDDDGEDFGGDEGSGGFMLIGLWIFIAIIIKLLRNYLKKRRVAGSRLERKLDKVKNRTEEAAC